VPARRQLSELGLPLDVIGGKDCQKVTKTPGHGETFTIGQNISVKALHTPCHTQDSICYFMQDGNDKVVFTGDTLFHGGMYAYLFFSCLPPFVLSGLGDLSGAVG